MKYLIASDLHGSAYYTRMMLDAFHSSGADRLLLLGDLLYHGPRNDLPRNYAPKEVLLLLNAEKDRIFAVRGNCEAEVDQMVLNFPVMADYALLEHGKNVIFVTHGHLYHKENPPRLTQGDILLHGHTHVPACEPCGCFTYLNPGSVSIPKEGSCHSYMTYEGGVFRWYDLETGAFYREFRD